MLRAGVAGPARGAQSFAGGVEGPSFTVLVADFAEQGDGLLVMVGSLLVAALLLIESAEVG